jgi:hypothetical protein
MYKKNPQMLVMKGIAGECLSIASLSTASRAYQEMSATELRERWDEADVTQEPKMRGGGA